MSGVMAVPLMTSSGPQREQASGELMTYNSLREKSRAKAVDHARVDRSSPPTHPAAGGRES